MVWLSGDSAMVGVVVGGVADGRVHLPLRVLREQGLALGEHRLHRALAPGAAEDEVDRGQPAARVELVQHHRRVDHAARVPAAPVAARRSRSSPRSRTLPLRTAS